ncbi:MAG: hypothetical protein M1834_000864 [Cirrosporium novae-zelandiae]|nr:MAG: hypothetical protein M1834_000864 [Cirrosporium novae-zelandiae]
MKEIGMGHTQILFNDPESMRKGKQCLASLDTTGGTVFADKACRFALYKAKKLDVKFILSGDASTFDSLVYDTSDSRKVIGVCTKDKSIHIVELVVAACGGWTPTVVPKLDSICETTGGSVTLIKIPRSSPFYDRFVPEYFPTWMFKMCDGGSGGRYGFPRDRDSYLKIGYRGTKYTNPKVQADELGAAGINIEKTWLCWYCDAYDNNFVIDHVPEKDGLMVATGGSGHAFKLLPNIGKWIVGVIEGNGLNRELI